MVATGNVADVAVGTAGIVTSVLELAKADQLQRLQPLAFGWRLALEK